MATLFAGTSGFSYPAWKPGFYPADVPASRFLEHYASRLNATEVNYSFRRSPSASTLEGWAARTPAHFVFAMKAHQRITHWLRLKGAEEATRFFLVAVAPRRERKRLGPVLLQLPPDLQRDDERLAAYLALLPTDLRFTFEFRHASWFTDEVYDLLRRHNVALCLAESETLVTPEVVTADFVYYRKRKAPYAADEMGRIEERSRALVAEGRDVFVFFKHEDTPAGALQAEELLAASAPG
jgi:uncharacterized protein YecE (DUF72 family)